MFDKIRDILFKNASENVRRAADIEYTRQAVLRKFPLLGVAMANLKTVPARRVGREEIEVAATDGEYIYYNPDFFDTLTDDQRVFIYAHEVMHVAFNHIMRSAGRNKKIWNQATDAVINQILKSEGLPMVDGGVDIATAIDKSAEEMYEKLLREQQANRQASDNGSGGGTGNADGRGNNADAGNDDDNEQVGHDNHKIWDDVVRRRERQQQSQSNQSPAPHNANQRHSVNPADNKSQSAPLRGDNVGDTSPGADGRDFNNWSPETDGKYEAGFEEQNRRVRTEMAARVTADLNSAKNRAMAAAVDESTRSFGDVGRSAPVMDWRRMLKKTLQQENDRWSYRRADSDNDYMARVEEADDDERGITQVLMDVSGSVSDDFLREFLRQLRPLLKDSQLFVGCFSNVFYPFVEIKNDRDINKFRIPPRGGTDWNLAAKSFSRGRHINKIVFTDGELPGRMPDASTRNLNIIWLVYGNEPFNPVCGRVIRVRPAQVQHYYGLTPSVRQR